MSAFADVKLDMEQRRRAEALMGDILDDPLAAAFELIWRRDVMEITVTVRNPERTSRDGGRDTT